MATKLGKVVTYHEELPLIKLYKLISALEEDPWTPN